MGVRIESFSLISILGNADTSMGGGKISFGDGRGTALRPSTKTSAGAMSIIMFISSEQSLLFYLQCISLGLDGFDASGHREDDRGLYDSPLIVIQDSEHFHPAVSIRGGDNW